MSKGEKGRRKRRSDGERGHGKQERGGQLWMELETEGQNPKKDV